MKNATTTRNFRSTFFALNIIAFFFIFVLLPSAPAFCQGKVAAEVSSMQKQKAFIDISPFSVMPMTSNPAMSKTVSKFTTLKANAELQALIINKPEYIKMNIPLENGAKNLVVVLYKTNISPGGFSLLTERGMQNFSNDNIVNYRGSIDNDLNSVASFSFSESETMGLISNNDGNYVIGKINDDNLGSLVIYNDKDLIKKNSFECGTQFSPQQDNSTNTNIKDSKITPSVLTSKCVNWYWETDYDVFVNKGSLVNVNNYIQGVFNQVATLYANDGIAINLKTLYVWTTADPYTGPTTSNYLDQFGDYRTTFDGDMANLIGLNGNGGIAWINTLCSGSPRVRQCYTGISTSYNTAPTYSWTVEVIAHEEGHLLGSNHTHDCAWNGNNTKIDDCGGYAGYSGGTCLPQPNPILPVGGGTIMSYCHLTSAGINFNLGFGPQPKARITNYINTASCLTSCGTCTVPAQPGIISGNTSVCPVSSQTYSVTAVAGATSYTWTLPSGWSGTSTTNSINVITGTTGGNISVTANNTCGSSTARTFAVTISATAPAQPGTISGNTSVCPVSSQTYSVTAVAGATSYTWTLPSGWSGTSATNSINVLTGTTGGNISVTANNTCGSSTARTFAVTISTTAPAQPGTISGNTSVCPASSQTYSVTAVTGATSYTWTLPSGWSGISITNSINVITGTTGGNISVTANNTCGSSTARTLTVTISTTVPAQPGTISGNSSVCPTSSETYSVTAVAGATSYTWTLPSGWSGTSTSNSINVITGTTGGNISVTANNTCGSSTASSMTITSSSSGPAQPGTISGNTTVCPASSQTYSVTAVTGATSYTWTLPSGWSGTSTTNSINVITSTTGGNISVTANNTCGSSTASSITITSSSSGPAQPGTIAGNTTVCPASSQTYSVTAVAGATSYTWTLPSGWSGSSTTNSIIVTSGTTGGTISINASNTCGTSTARTLTVTTSSNAPGNPGTISGNNIFCPGTVQTYSISVVNGATNYTWTLPANWSGSSTSNTISVTTGSSAGTITVRANNGCGSSTGSNLITSLGTLPVTPGNITVSGGDVKVCAGDTRTYTVSNVSGVTYNWNAPAGATITSGQGTNSIVLNFNSNFISAGTLSVNAENGCGSSGARNLAIYQNVPAVPGSISILGGINKICSGESRTFKVTAVTNVNYSWQVPNGAVISSGQGTNSILVSFNSSFVTSGNVSVQAVNGCGNSSSRTFPVYPNSPAMPGTITVTGGIANVCPGDIRTYSVSSVAGLTYNWTVPAGAVITGGQGSNSITINYGTGFTANGTLSVTANNNCGSSIARTLTIAKNIPSTPSSISTSGGIAKVCPGDIRIYSVTDIAGMNYNWTTPAGAIITSGQGTSSITVSFVSVFLSNGNLSVIATSGCGNSSARTLSISNNFPASPGGISGLKSVCPGTVTTYSIVAVATATSYVWSVPTGAIIQGNSDGNSISVLWGTSGGSVTVKSNNACGSSVAKTLSVTNNCLVQMPEKTSVNIQPMVFPNPSEGMVNIRFFTTVEDNYNIILQDVTGRILRTEKYSATQGVNTRQYNWSWLANGLYYVIIENKETKKVLRFEMR